MTTQTFTGTLTILECANCRVYFGITQGFEQDRRDDHRIFYCPFGHENYYPQKSTEEKLRAQLARQEGATAAARANAEQERRKAAAARGQVTKMKKRIGKGVCPCCNRHFVNVERHMASQHPELANG